MATFKEMKCSWEQPQQQRCSEAHASDTVAGLRSDWGLFSVVSDDVHDITQDTATAREHEAKEIETTSAHEAKEADVATAPLGRWVTRRAQSLRCKGGKLDEDVALLRQTKTERVLRYEIPGSRYLTLHKPLSGDPGTQGLLCPMAKRMSPSEEVLAWLICKNPELFEGKYCLELGAGLGLAGLM